MLPQLTLTFALVRKPSDILPDLIVHFRSYAGVLLSQIQHLHLLFGLRGVLKFLSQYLEFRSFVYKSGLLTSLENILFLHESHFSIKSETTKNIKQVRILSEYQVGLSVATHSLRGTTGPEVLEKTGQQGPHIMVFLSGLLNLFTSIVCGYLTFSEP